MRHVFRPVDVECRNNIPARVHWDGVEYRVRSLIECWVVETRWWTDDDRERRVYYRLHTDRAVLEIFRTDDTWVLARISD